MAEDTQDDLSMEDILSSIKDILDKETQPQTTAPENVPALEPVVAQAPTQPKLEDASKEEAEVKEDDVFDLSKEMIIDNSLISDKSDDIDLNLDDIETNLDNINIDPITTSSNDVEEEFNIPEIDAEDVSEEVFEEPDAKIEEDTLLEITSSDPLDFEEENVADFDISDIESSLDNGSEDSLFTSDPNVDAEPIFTDDSEMVMHIDDILSEEALGSESDEQAEEKEIIPTTEMPEFVQNIDDILSTASKVIYADSPKNKFVEEEPTIVPATEEKSKEEASPEGDVVDISANIISNFAKMFADKKEEAPIETTPVVAPVANVTVTETGNISKTIEQVVEDTIKDIIGASVSAELTAHVDIAAYAKLEIKAQTQAWLEAHLPAVVEAAVQKEIERVMAKVGK